MSFNNFVILNMLRPNLQVYVYITDFYLSIISSFLHTLHNYMLSLQQLELKRNIPTFLNSSYKIHQLHDYLKIINNKTL